MNQLTFLNIYEDDIIDARDTAQSLIVEAGEVLSRFSDSDFNAYYCRDILDDDVLRRLSEGFDVENLTNALIGAYFQCAIDAIMDNSFFEEHGFSFDYVANFSCSDIYVHWNKDDAEECQYYSQGTLTEMIRDALFDEVWAGLSPLLDEFMSDSGESFDKAWLENDLASLGDGEFFETIEELREYVDAGELSEEFKEELKESLGLEERD